VAKNLKPETQDLLFSCPPYFDLEVYSDLPNDASNQKDYQSYLEVLGKAFAASYDCLKPDRFAVIVIGDVRDKKTGAYRGIPSDIVRIMTTIGFTLYNDAVLLNETGTGAIRASRYFNGSRKLVKLHQNVLVFYKGDLKKIPDNYPKLELPSEGEQTEEVASEV